MGFQDTSKFKAGFADDANAAAIKEAEEKIQRILLDLWEFIGFDIDEVQVDTRQFANYKVEIFFES